LIETDVLVVGGGVIGLSCVNQIPPGLRSLVIEKKSKCGQGISSRNSEVIHSGIHYAHGSLKTEHCKVGRNEIYRYCEKNKIGYRQCGKYVVATNPQEEERLLEIVEHCEYEVVPFQRVGRDWLSRKVPFLKASSALYFPLSGIFDSHQFIKSLESKAQNKGTTLVMQTEFLRVLNSDPWIVEVNEQGKILQVKSKIIINAAGFDSAEICNRVLGFKKFEHRPCAGRYFSLSGFFKGALDVLVYPIPEKDGLGIHLTPDMEGNARLGPDADWGESADVDWDNLKEVFVNRVRNYLPEIQSSHLRPGFVGVRPKLFLENHAYPDFLIHSERNSIHLLGIESPGLTASLSLGASVGRLVEEII